MFKLTNIYQTLSAIDVSDKIKTKNNMKYLPWSTAWEYMKSADPEATYKIVKDENGIIYHTDGRTCWVETCITAGGMTQGETLAIMDNRNQSIPLDNVSSTNVNKSLKRCLVKNCALFGLGLNLWYGEELSDNARKDKIKTLSEQTVLSEKAISLCKELTSKGSDAKTLASMLKDTYGEGNPKKIKDTGILQAMIGHLEKMLEVNE